jgi:hypothetical protein
MKVLMVELEDNAYHGRKFGRLLKLIADQGRLVITYTYLYTFY